MPDLIRPSHVAIYVRWSTDDQARGTTLEVQLESCRNYILSQGWEPSEALTFVDDGYSGGTLERPSMDRLRKAVSAGFVDCVIIYRLDRLARNIVDAVNLVLQEWEGQTYVKSACEPIDTTTPLGRQIFVMLSGFADWERAIIRDRLMSGKIALVQKGKDPGGMRPYGYVAGAERNSYAQEPSEALIVRRIFEMYIAGSSINEITIALNDDGLTTRRGRAWAPSSIAWILRNPVYTGYLVYGIKPAAGRNKAKQHKKRLDARQPSPVYRIKSRYIPPIIDEVLFQQAKIAREDAARTYKTDTRNRLRGHTSLLASIARCRCGASINASWTHNGYRQYRYYRCSCAASAHALSKRKCECRRVDMDIADALVVQMIREAALHACEETIVSSRILDGQREQIESLDKQITNYDQQIATMQERFQQLADSYIAGILPAAAYSAAANSLDNQTSRLTELRVQTAARRDALADRQGLAAQLDAQISKLQDVEWDAMEMLDKRRTIAALARRIELYKACDGELEVSIDYIWDSDVEGRAHAGEPNRA